MLFLSPAALAKDENTFTLEKAQEWARSNSPYLELTRLEHQAADYAAMAARRDYDDLDKDIWNIRYQIRRAAEDEGRASEKLGKILDDNGDNPQDNPLYHLYRQEMELAAQRAYLAESSLDSIISARREQRHVANLAEAQRVMTRLQVTDRELLLDRLVEEKFYSLLLLEEQHHHLEDTLFHLIHRQQQGERQIALGLITPRDLIPLRAKTREVRQLYEAVDTLRKLSRQELNLHLGRDPDAPLILEGSFVPKPEEELMAEEPSSVRETTAYRALTKQIEVWEKRLQDLSAEYSKGHPRYREAETMLEKLKLERSQAQKTWEMASASALNQIKEKLAALAVEETRLENARTELELAKRKQQLGIVPGAEVREKELVLKEAQIRYNQAVLDYNLAVTDVHLAQKGILPLGQSSGE